MILCKVCQDFKLADEIHPKEIKVAEQYFPLVLYTLLCEIYYDSIRSYPETH